MDKTWAEASHRKILHPDKLSDKVEMLRSKEQKIASLNGSFDLLHAGHLEIIYQASLEADQLIVALNTDRSIQSYKGLDRPIIPLKHRLSMMAALEFVDFVTWFDEDDPRNILSVIKPDVHINGSEYGKECIEAETVQKYGGKVHVVSLVPGLSTSQIIRKIKKD